LRHRGAQTQLAGGRDAVAAHELGFAIAIAIAVAGITVAIAIAIPSTVAITIAVPSTVAITIAGITVAIAGLARITIAVAVGIARDWICEASERSWDRAEDESEVQSRHEGDSSKMLVLGVDLCHATTWIADDNHLDLGELGIGDGAVWLHR
jgi:hypothetical protein